MLNKGEQLTKVYTPKGYKVITVEEAATAMNVSKGSVYNLIRGDELKHIRIRKLIPVSKTTTGHSFSWIKS